MENLRHLPKEVQARLMVPSIAWLYGIFEPTDDVDAVHWLSEWNWHWNEELHLFVEIF